MSELMPGSSSNILEAGASSAIAGAPQASAEKIAGFMKLMQSLTGNSSMIPKDMPLTTMQPTLTTPQAPQAPFNAGGGEIPQGSFATAGERKRAEFQSMINNVANIVQKGQDYIHQKRVRDMSMKTERLLAAFQGMEQAKASGDEAAMQHNQEIINDMFSDPKNVKMFQKAFDVKLLGDDKGKATPEHQGLMKAMQEWKQGGGKGLNPMASKFANSFPMQAGMNPALTAIAQLIKAKILPEANKQMEQQTEMMKQVAELTKSGITNESKEKIADMFVNAKDRATQASLVNAVVRETGRQGAAQILAAAHVKSAQLRLQGVRESAQYRLTESILSNWSKERQVKNKTGAVGKQQDLLIKQWARLDSELKTKERVLSGLSSFWNREKYEQTTKDIDAIEQQMRNVQEQTGELTNSLKGVASDEPDTGSRGEGKSEPDSSSLFDDFFSDNEN